MGLTFKVMASKILLFQFDLPGSELFGSPSQRCLSFSFSSTVIDLYSLLAACVNSFVPHFIISFPFTQQNNTIAASQHKQTLLPFVLPKSRMKTCQGVSFCFLAYGFVPSAFLACLLINFLIQFCVNDESFYCTN